MRLFLMAGVLVASVLGTQASLAQSITSNNIAATSTGTSSAPWGVSISGRVGSLGVGPEVGYHAPGTHWGVRGFYDTYSVHLDHVFTKQMNVVTPDVDAHVPVDFDGTLKMSNGGLMGDYYPWKHSGFRLSGGVMYRGDHAYGRGMPQGYVTRYGEFRGHQYSFSEKADQYGRMHSSGLFNAVQPMLGLGYGGRIWGPLSMTVDAAAAYEGHPKVSTWATGEVANVPVVHRAVERAGADIRDKVHGINFFPVLMVGFGYTF